MDINACTPFLKNWCFSIINLYVMHTQLSLESWLFHNPCHQACLLMFCVFLAPLAITIDCILRETKNNDTKGPPLCDTTLNIYSTKEVVLQEGSLSLCFLLSFFFLGFSPLSRDKPHASLFRYKRYDTLRLSCSPFMRQVQVWV